MGRQPQGVHQLGVFDQLPFVVGYTVILLGFSVQSATDEEIVTTKLQDATKAMIEAFPWLRGKLAHAVPSGEESVSTGTYSISLDSQHDYFIVKDCKSILPTYSELQAAQAPVSKLPGDLLSPRPGLPKTSDPTKEVMPAFIVQANFVHGGLLLAFATQHNVSDMNGQGQLIRLFAQALRQEPFTEEQLKWGNIDRATVIPPIKDGESLPDFKYLRGTSGLGKVAKSGADPVHAPWKVVRFPSEALRELKERATATMHTDSTTNGASIRTPQWVSTNDVVSAFLWQRVTQSRSQRLPPNSTVNIVRFVNSRKRLKPQIPEEYIGHVVGVTPGSFPLSDVVEHTNLGRVAADLRRSVDEYDDFAVRALAHTLANKKDKTTINYVATLTLTKDFMVSSWGELRLSEQVFGLLGMPDWCRRPNFESWESLAYVVEKSRNGDYYIEMSLRSEDWIALQNDPLWTTRVEVIG